MLLVPHQAQHVAFEMFSSIGLWDIPTNAKQQSISQDAQHFDVQQLSVHQAPKGICIDVMHI